MRFNCQDCDISFVRSIRPKHPARRRRVALKVRLKNLDPVFARQIVDFMRRQAVVSRILRKVAKRLDKFLEEPFLVLVQLGFLLAPGEVVLECLHLRHAHADLERH